MPYSYSLTTVTAKDEQHLESLQGLLSSDFNATQYGFNQQDRNGLTLDVTSNSEPKGRGKVFTGQQKKSLRKLGYKLHNFTVYGL